MNRTLLFTVLLATAGVAQAHDEQRIRDIDKVNGSITAEAGQFYGDLSTVNGGIDLQRGAKVEDVETVNGGIFFDRGSNVRRGVSTVNGGIGLVDTDLGGGIETVNGDITVGVGSHVKGGIRVEKPTGNWGLRMGKPKVPRIVIGPNAVVEGNLVFEREVTLHVHQSARIGNVSGATAQRYSTATPPQD